MLGARLHSLLRLSVAMLNDAKRQNLRCNDEQDSQKMGDGSEVATSDRYIGSSILNI